MSGTAKRKEVAHHTYEGLGHSLLLEKGNKTSMAKGDSSAYPAALVTAA